MKIIIILVVTFFSGVKSSYAIEKNEIIKIKNLYSICEKDQVYRTYQIEYKLRYAFFLNLSDNYNLNFEDYYPISFEESPFPSDIQYFSGTDIMDYDPFYLTTLHRVLWERLYPDKTFTLCNYTSKESYYDEIESKINSIYEGPDFIKNVAYQDEGVIYEYTFPYLGYFKIVSSEGINAQIEGTKLKVSGNKGRYQIILKRKVNVDGFTENLFTDGTNYLMMYPKVTEQDYIFNVVIGERDVILKIKNEQGNILKNICFKINEEKYCSNDEGIINFSTSSNYYKLEFNGNESYKAYNQIMNVTKVQDIILSKNESMVEGNEDENNPLDNVVEVTSKNEEKKEEDQIIVEVKDTFTIAKGIIFLITIVIFIYVIFKTI